MTDGHDTQPLIDGQELIANLREVFVNLARCAADAANAELVAAAVALADLLTVAAILGDDSATQARSGEIVEFCRDEALPALTDTTSDGSFTWIRSHVEDRWSDCLSLLAPEERFTCNTDSEWSAEDDHGWDCVPSAGTVHSHSADEDNDQSFTVDLEGILASLADRESLSRGTASEEHKSSATSVAEANSLPRPPRDQETIDDPEMVAAFVDDAQQCLAEMEASLLSLEADGAADDALRNFCRQLHTLKGASGTVGLAKLARYLHELESYVEAASGNDIDVDRLLEGVDAVRAQLTTLGKSDAVASTGPTSSIQAIISDSQNVGTPLPSDPVAGKDEEVFVRVEASRLERLMDLLAELVMLRNRRDTYVQSLRTIHGELNHCASRTRALTTTVELSAPATTGIEDSTTIDFGRQTAKTRLLSRSLDEVSKDTAELSRSLQEVFDPLSDDNSAVSHLIGRFRQELMELRRLPIGGLFQRLQRAIRDAAKAEGKTVEINFEGQGARAERAVQERLFEPLLHLVRNAVSHGVQPREQRIRSGKPAAGRITLAAWSDAASLCIEVRDDGCGLDDEALELRGRELGLLPPGETVSPTQLRKLIFHPGFSTKTSVSEISGRGVGMDVVDTWVRRLRGRIDVESTPGQGTTFRLRIPLRSAIEHAMVVRAGGQLFALPMHTVSGTSDSKVPMSGLPDVATDADVVPLTCILGSRNSQTTRGCHVTLHDAVQNSRTKQRGVGGRVTIVVDAVVGVEEVVVRSLPPLLQRNELFAGVTLSGRAETVLLLDVRRLIELSRSNGHADSESLNESTFDDDRTRKSEDHCCILVVDDSVVVRRSLSKKLRANGCEIREAGNGREALDVLKSEEITGVVTDIDMPGMNGVELLHAIRRQKQLQALPVVVLTSRDEESMRREILHLQPTAILSKPVTDGTVAEIIGAMGDKALLGGMAATKCELTLGNAPLSL